MGAPADSTQTDIDPEQLAQWMAEEPELQVVDVREDYEREAGYIEGSRHIPLVELSVQGSGDRARASARVLLPRGRALGHGRPSVSGRRRAGAVDARRARALGE